MSLEIGHRFTFSADIVGKCPTTGAYLVTKVEKVKAIYKVNDFVTIDGSNPSVALVMDTSCSSSTIQFVIGKNKEIYYNSTLRFATEEEIDNALRESKILEEKKKEEERLAKIEKNRAELRSLIATMSVSEKIETFNALMQSIIPPAAPAASPIVETQEKEKEQK